MANKIAYFLIGGNGFIGKAFYNYLKQKGEQVRVIERGEISDGRSMHSDIETLSKFITSLSANVIIDFAYTSIPNTSFSDPVKDFTENLYNVNAHLAFASKLPNASYVYISSGGTVYGNTKIDKPITEELEKFPLSPYGITKLASEKYVLMHHNIYNLPVKIVRPANIYGPGQKPYRGQGFIPTAMAKILEKGKLSLYGDGSIVRDYLYVNDFCEALRCVIDSGENGQIYNIGSGEGLTINNIINLLAKMNIGKINIENLLQRPFDVKYNVLDYSKLKQLGWQPETSIQNGLINTWEWIVKYFKDKP